MSCLRVLALRVCSINNTQTQNEWLNSTQDYFRSIKVKFFLRYFSVGPHTRGMPWIRIFTTLDLLQKIKQVFCSDVPSTFCLWHLTSYSQANHCKMNLLELWCCIILNTHLFRVKERRIRLLLRRSTTQQAMLSNGIANFGLPFIHAIVH